MAQKSRSTLTKILLILVVCVVGLSVANAVSAYGGSIQDPFATNRNKDHQPIRNPSDALKRSSRSVSELEVKGSNKLPIFKHAFDVVRGAAFLFYGLSLVLYGDNFDHQVHFLVMMRVTGFETVKQGFGVLSESIFHTHRQVKKQMPVLKKAQADLAVARAEVERLREVELKIKENESQMSPQSRRILEAKRKAYVTNAAALQEATESLEKIVEATQADAVWDVISGFFGMTTAVMATGHHVEYVSRAIGLVCHVANFVMMGNSLLNQLCLRSPVSAMLHRLLFGKDDELVPHHIKGGYSRIEQAVHQVTMWGAVLAFWFLANRQARHLHLSLLGAFITLTGLRWLLQGLTPGRHYSGIAQALRRPPGGVVLVVVTILGYIGRPHFQGKAAWIVEHFLYAPLVYLEEGVDELVHLAEMLE